MEHVYYSHKNYRVKRRGSGKNPGTDYEPENEDLTTGDNPKIGLVI